MKARRSKGALLFASTGQTQAELASRLGIAPSYVAMLQNGQRRPGLELRKLMFERLGIPIENWDEEPASATEPSSPAAPAWGARTAQRRLERLEKMASDLGGEIESVKDHTLFERTRAAERLAGLEARISKLRGEEIPESTLLQTRYWQRIEQALLGALKPFPDAMKAVGEALRELDEAS